MRNPVRDPIGRLNAASFDLLLGQRDVFGVGKGAPAFDLGGVRFVTPAALVQLAAASHFLASQGRRPMIILGGSPIRGYLIRVGFIRLLERVADFSPWFPGGLSVRYDHLRGSNDMLIEVTRVDTDIVLKALLTRIVRVLRDRLRYSKRDAFMVAQAVSEACQNALDHAEQGCGFLAMQGYSAGRDPYLEIGIADYGGGLAATLKRNPTNPPISSDVEAIRLAVQLGVSEYDDRTHGTGLHHLLRIAHEHQGSVQIRSGTGKAQFRRDDREGRFLAVPPMPGVQIALVLRTCDKP